MQAALAEVSDLAALMKVTFPDPSDELSQAELLLQMASAWARSYAQRIWATPNDIPAWQRDTVVGIILAGVRRDLVNPRRVTYEVQGPMSASYSSASCPPGFFTTEELNYLTSCRHKGNAWIQKTYRDDPEESIGYLYGTWMPKPIPMYAPGDTEAHGNVYLR